MRVINIPIDRIDTGERRRQDLGDIAALAKGMKRVGQLAAIIVDRGAEKGRFRLIAGERRLTAARKLRWETIAASLRENLSDDELREIEWEENENRKSLTEQERRKTFKASKCELENAQKAGEVYPHDAGKPKGKGSTGGRPSKYGKPKPEVAADLGISEDTLERAERHVELAERYPWLQSDAWRQADVLRLRKHLDRIPAPEQGKLCQFIERSAAPLQPRPEIAVEYAEVMSLKTPAERSDIYRLSGSGDQRDRDLAQTRALHRPPMPDKRLAHIDDALRDLGRSLKPPYDREPEADAFARVIAQLEELRRTIQVRFQELKKEEARYVEEDVRRQQTLSA